MLTIFIGKMIETTSEKGHAQECSFLSEYTTPDKDPLLLVPLPFSRAEVVDSDVLEMEDKMFAEAKEVYELINSPASRQVDGMPYETILESPELSDALGRIRSNIPSYMYLSSKQKKHHFRKISKDYQAKVEPRK